MSTSSQRRRENFFPLSNNRHRRLHIEGLEDRQVLAGNVLAAVVGGNLVVSGDSADNDIHLHTNADGAVEVSGGQAGGLATTINGEHKTFTAADVRTFTRVGLGAGDDHLQISTEAAVESSATDSLDASSNVVSRKHLMINTGAGNDTVAGEVSSDVTVHLQGDNRNDNVSIESLADVGVDVEIDPGIDFRHESESPGLAPDVAGHLSADMVNRLNASNANASANAEVSANVDTSLVTDSLVHASDSSSSASGSLDIGIDASGDVDADLSTAATGIGTNADIDTAITANLLLDSALNSASNLGSDSLLNVDNNLNGSIGGAAALNLVGDGGFDEIGPFNASGIANLSVDDAANLAVLNANTFALTANQADAFFADFGNQSRMNANANLNAEAGLLSNLGSFDTQGNSALSGSLNTSFNGVFNSRLIGIPLA